ncbi:MAG: DUF6288 domain-containing protein [Lentisphaeria bacterium]|nr:DUF6288 domain-containing protein [Lentisphaeria bacterium]
MRPISYCLVFSFILSMICTAATGNSDALVGSIDSAYYKDYPLFHMYPDEKAARQTLKRFGPVGISLDLLQPAFTMRITGIDEGSPAAATGKLKVGQYIESVNGRVLKDEDPRIILGDVITEAEAADGIVKLMVKDTPAAAAEAVVVRIPVLGAYSDTWPMNCEKSDAIVRNFADFLARVDKPGWGAPLFLLSTGEEKDLAVVRRWFSGKLPGGVQGFPWSIGYTGPAVCEYYLRTGDESVLPAIKGMADYLTKTIYNGSWMGRGGANFQYMAGGHMNAAGVHCVTFLLLAKECGVDVDEHTLQSSLKHFFRYAGHWNVSYGDGLPEGGGVDNGKNGGLAFAMAAAASLTPEGEASIYAKARDISANKSFYTTSWLFHGHTGGGIGELWRGAAMGLLAEKRPEPYRSFMRERRWMYELARTHDGAFGWSSTWNVNYDTTGHDGGRSWGNYIPLVYTVPRKQLRIFGAPPSEYSTSYQLPKRPWGTTADEAFYSLEAGEYKPGKRQDLSEERIPSHAAWPTLRKLKNPKITDDELLMYACHPDSTARGTAAGSIAAMGRRNLAMELLRSKDPRGRYAGLRALGGKVDEEQIRLVGDIISDSEESWWVVMEAMNAISAAPAEKIAPYYESLAKWLEHDDWWLRYYALKALTPLAVKKPYYSEILPVISDMIATNQRAVALQPLGGIVNGLKNAPADVQAFALNALSKAYLAFPTELHAPGGQDLSAGVDYLLANIARNLANAPGGFDALYKVSRERFPKEILPHKTLYMAADSSVFGPAVQEALKPLVKDYLIPQYIGAYNHIATNSDLLLNEANSTAPLEWNFYYREPRMNGLVDLYNRIGIHDYDWHLFGPDLMDIDYRYHSFDPKEEKIFGGTRYREVTFPEGMEDWYKPAFDTEAAGWKTGRAPFGQKGGKLVGAGAPCRFTFCRCGEAMNTLWEKEVLLMRTKTKFPAFKEGHRYRLVVGGMSHVNRGEGFRVYVNGKLLLERDRGVGKREGAKPVGYYLDKAWWPDFEDDVTIAAIGFLQHNTGSRQTQQHFSIFLQEMKNPPITEEMILRGKLLQPMLSSDWQATKDDQDKFLYDGEFRADPQATGDWVAIGQVGKVDEFDTPAAAKPLDETAALKTLSLKADGRTGDERLRWSGDTLMNLKTYEALKMRVQTIDGKAYLLVESGGFNKKRPEDWTCPWIVMAAATAE